MSVFKMSPRPGMGVVKDKSLRPREGVVYRTPTGQLAMLQARKKEDGNSYHFHYRDARDEVVGVFALSVSNVGILREVG
jgi:hypothetical protein